VTVVATLAPLQVTAFVLVAVGATAVVLVRDPLRQALLNGFYGLVLVVLFVVLGAPDVALSMLVVSTVAYPFVILVAVARVRSRRTEKRDSAGERKT
jgi:energy-converting hydrogenase B subunit D